MDELDKYPFIIRNEDIDVRVSKYGDFLDSNGYVAFELEDEEQKSIVKLFRAYKKKPPRAPEDIDGFLESVDIVNMLINEKVMAVFSLIALRWSSQYTIVNTRICDTAVIAIEDREKFS